MGYLTPFKAAGASIALAGFCLLAGQVAASTTVKAKFTGVSPSKSVDLYYYNTQDNKNYKLNDTSAGVFNFKWKSGDTSIITETDGTFASFCIDTAQSVSKGKYTWDLAPLSTAPEYRPLTAARASDLAKLFGGTFGAGVTLNDGAKSLNSKQAAAMQMAVWEVVNESESGSYNVFYGNSRFEDVKDENNKDIRKLANTYLEYISNGIEMGGLKALTKDGVQDFVVQAVPLPAAAWFFGSALLGAGFVSRRRKKQLAA